jgi:hydroxymethylbilane synthase
MKQKVIIGSRGSDLALWQANFVQAQLQKLGCDATINIIKTQGDKIQHLSFDKMEGKGFFTKEIEEALLNGSIDLAIHSHKDLETNQPEGLKVAAVSYRENPAEWLLIRKESVDLLHPMQLKLGAIVGTSAARRKSQLSFYRPDVELKDLRGNVPTRIDKLRMGQYDAILLAAAGAQRLQLDLSEFNVVELDARIFVPAPAQGVLAYQIRSNDFDLEAILQNLNDAQVASTIEIERKVLNLLHGGCQVPFGAHCIIDQNNKHFWAFYAPNNGESRRLYMNFKNDQINFDSILAKLREPVSKSVLITRNLAESNRNMLTSAGMEITEQSFINIESVDNENPDFSAFNWIFFTSPNAVANFKEFDSVSNHQIAAIGSGTGVAVRAKGFDVHFQGDGKTTDIASEFKQVLGSDKVLIVCAESGLRTIQLGLDSNSFEEMIVYRTVANSVKLNQIPQVIAFTSPSNAASFVVNNIILPQTSVVAIGHSTAAALRELNIDVTAIAWQSSELALADTILGLD